MSFSVNNIGFYFIKLLYYTLVSFGCNQGTLGGSEMSKESKKKTRTFCRWVLSFFKPYWGWLFINIISSIISVANNIFIVYLIKEMISSAIIGKPNMLNKLLACLLIMIVSGILAKYLAKYSSGRFSLAIIRDLKNNLANRIIDVKIERIEEYHSGDINSTLVNDAATFQKFLEDDFSSCIYYPLIILASFSYMLLINWQLLLVCFLVTPITMLITNVLSKPIKKFSQEYHQSLGEYNSLVDEMVKGIQTIKAFNSLKMLNQRCQAIISKIFHTGLKIDQYNSLLLPGTIIMYELPFILCMVFGGYLSIKGAINPVNLIAFLQLLTFLIYPTTFLPRLLANSRLVMGAIERLYEVSNLQLEESRQIRSLNQKAYAIELNDCCFQYQNSGDVLAGVSLKILQEQTVALVGASGSGKSTIISLICGFYRLRRGSLKIFGHEIDEWDISKLRSMVSVVSQNVFLFPGSIAKNIAYGRLGASEMEIIQASKLAGSHDFILKMPEGYNTLVGERGIKLSGGERQRISLARAVLKDAPILLLDEPTSALDSESEAVFQKALVSCTDQRTVLVVAHRLSTIKGVDQILVLDRGKIVERGTHLELMNNMGVYLNLYREQMKSIGGR